MKKSIFDLDENVAALLSYVLIFFSGIVVLIMEKENRFVRFHALQSILLFLPLFIIRWVLSALPLIGGLLGGLLTIIMVVSALFLMYNAYLGKTFKVPVIGDVVDNQLNK